MMPVSQNPRISKIIDRLGNPRKFAWAAGAIAVYALLGFFLAPWLVQKNMIEILRRDFSAELRVANVAVNPFTLTLRMSVIELDDPVGAQTARVDEIFINFQLSSIFRWAFTFDEFRVTGPELFIARNKSGDLNIAYLFEDAGGSESGDTVEVADDSALTRLLVFKFAINDCTVNWSDDVPVDPVETRFGPINIEIDELNTLPQRAGQQTVLITTESQGTLSWSGSLQLNPLKSSAHASIKGSHFPLTSAYIRHETGFDIVDGNADVELDYTLGTMTDGTLRATVENFNLAFNDVVVHTFSASTGTNPIQPDKEVLRLPAIRLTDGSLRWPEQTVSFNSLDIDNALLSLERDDAGTLNIVSASAAQTATPGTVDPVAVADPADHQIAQETSTDKWQVSLGEFSINHLAMDLQDHSVAPMAEVGVADFNVAVHNLSNKPGARFPTTVSIRTTAGATITMDGDIAVLPSPIVNFSITVDDIGLARAHPYIRPIADVNLNSGTLDLTGRFSSSDADPLLFNGDFEIADFEIAETDEGSRLGSWKRLGGTNVALSLGNDRLEVSEIHIEKPYADLRIAQDGSLNLGRVDKADDMDAADGSNRREVNTDAAGKIEETESQLAITIGRVMLTDASADFADYSLPLPFSAKIDALNGSISTISTESAEPSTVALEGKVDDHGFVSITGSVTPFNPSRKTDLAIVFQNINIPKFTAYSVPFAGRKIANGSLDLELGYAVTDSELVGDNTIVLRDFELGEKVEHPGAMSLPLGLAVALLKDPDGKIDIDLPVRGNIDDPEFSYGGVVLKALANLVIKIVAAPFTLLANLLGVESSDLEYINFLDGRSDLTPPELQRAGNLAEAMSLRPNLVLEIPGVVDREADGLALRTAQLDATVEARIATLTSGADDEAMYSDQRQLVLVQMFTEQSSTDDASLELEQLRVQFTTVSDTEGDDAPDTQFDKLAYTNEIRRQLIGLQTVSEIQLTELAQERKENTRAAILANDETLDDRIILGKNLSVTRQSDEPIRMKVTLSTGSD